MPSIDCSLVLFSEKKTYSTTRGQKLPSLPFSFIIFSFVFHPIFIFYFISDLFHLMKTIKYLCFFLSFITLDNCNNAVLQI